MLIKRKIVSIINKFGQYLSNRRGNKNLEKIYYFLNDFIRIIDNVNFNSFTNGEYRWFDRLDKKGVNVIFDVGANVGDWANYATGKFPEAEIHCFELVPSTFDILNTNCKGNEKLRLNNFGLSKTSGEIEIFQAGDSVISTAHKINSFGNHREIYQIKELCNVSTGKLYSLEHKISEIDILKIDTEGHDLQVIKGFGDMIENVKIIQFEYGVFNISSKDLLCNFFEYLESKDFRILKIFPNYLMPLKYHFDLENFHGGNFLAVNNRFKIDLR
jgi:FkbM family methyltransferase